MSVVSNMMPKNKIFEWHVQATFYMCDLPLGQTWMGNPASVRFRVIRLCFSLFLILALPTWFVYSIFVIQQLISDYSSLTKKEEMATWSCGFCTESKRFWCWRGKFLKNFPMFIPPDDRDMVLVKIFEAEIPLYLDRISFFFFSRLLQNGLHNVE